MNDKRNVLLLCLLDRQIQLHADSNRSQVTFSAQKYLRLCWREGWGVDVVVLSTLWNTHIFRDWWRSSLGYYNHFYVFSFIRIYLFFNLLNFYPVTRYCVIVFSNTRGAISPQSINQRLYLTSNLAELLISLKNINLQNWIKVHQ